MPKRTFIPNLLKYRRTHGFLHRLHDNPQLLARQKRVMYQNRHRWAQEGPKANFLRRLPRQMVLPPFP